jgi:hypothetical protein
MVQKFYPLGFPLEIATNSGDVIAAATESWGGFACEFEREPIRVRAIVQPGGADSAPEPVYRLQGGLLAIVSDRVNFAACDFLSRSGWCLVPRKLLPIGRGSGGTFLKLWCTCSCHMKMWFWCMAPAWFARAAACFYAARPERARAR